MLEVDCIYLPVGNRSSRCKVVKMDTQREKYTIRPKPNVLIMREVEVFVYPVNRGSVDAATLSVSHLSLAILGRLTVLHLVLAPELRQINSIGGMSLAKISSPAIVNVNMGYWVCSTG